MTTRIKRYEIASNTLQDIQLLQWSLNSDKRMLTGFLRAPGVDCDVSNLKLDRYGIKKTFNYPKLVFCKRIRQRDALEPDLAESS